MKPLEVGSFEAKNRLSELLKLAEKGQKIYITRRGKRVALLAGVRETEPAGSREVLAAFRQFRERCGSGPESLKELIEEGRR